MEMDFVSRVEQMFIGNETRQGTPQSMPERFAALMKQMQQDDEGKFDFTTNLHSIDLNDKNGRLIIPVNGGREEFEATDWAYGQLMNRLGIPSAYARKLPANLLRPHFEYWKKGTKDTKLFIRARKERDNRVARAFLSPSYSVLDNNQLLKAFQEAVPRQDYRVVSFNVEEDYFDARLIFNHLVRRDNVGPNGKTNPFFAGLHIMNGETGGSSVSVDLIIYEQWCTNGAIRRFGGRSMLQRKHIGKNLSLVELLEERLDGISSLADETMERFMNSKRVEIRQPKEYLGSFMQRHPDHFTRELREGVLRAWELRPEKTLYGVISALTQTANLLPPEKRVEIEVLAGRLMGGDR